MALPDPVETIKTTYPISGSVLADGYAALETLGRHVIAVRGGEKVLAEIEKIAVHFSSDTSIKVSGIWGAEFVVDETIPSGRLVLCGAPSTIVETGGLDLAQVDTVAHVEFQAG